MAVADLASLRPAGRSPDRPGETSMPELVRYSYKPVNLRSGLKTQVHDCVAQEVVFPSRAPSAFSPANLVGVADDEVACASAKSVASQGDPVPGPSR
jgi:hypothetical protein